MYFEYLKIEVFIPEEFVEKLRKELNQEGVLKTGKYDNCIAVLKNKGYWRPLEGTKPYLGNIGEVCCADECKVEFRVKSQNLQDTIDIIKKIHPYEEPVINVLPLLNI